MEERRRVRIEAAWHAVHLVLTCTFKDCAAACKLVPASWTYDTGQTQHVNLVPADIYNLHAITEQSFKQNFRQTTSLKHLPSDLPRSIVSVHPNLWSGNPCYNAQPDHGPPPPPPPPPTLQQHSLIMKQVIALCCPLLSECSQPYQLDRLLVLLLPRPVQKANVLGLIARLAIFIDSLMNALSFLPTWSSAFTIFFFPPHNFQG